MNKHKPQAHNQSFNIKKTGADSFMPHGIEGEAASHETLRSINIFLPFCIVITTGIEINKFAVIETFRVLIISRVYY